MREIFTEEVIFKLRLKDKHLFLAWAVRAFHIVLIRITRALR